MCRSMPKPSWLNALAVTLALTIGQFPAAPAMANSTDVVIDASSSSVASASSMATAKEVLGILNAARSKAGCGPLKINNKLMAAAKTHATNMAQKDFFGHANRDGSKFSKRVKRQGYKYRMVAENIAAGQASGQTGRQCMAEQRRAPPQYPELQAQGNRGGGGLSGRRQADHGQQQAVLLLLGAGFRLSMTRRIFIDADACPVKAEAERVATRHGVKMVLVSNGGIRPSQNPLVESVFVAAGPDEADKWIADACGPGDVVVTGDIPLAAKCVAAGARVVKHNGEELTAANVGHGAGDAGSDGRPAVGRPVPSGRRQDVLQG